MGKLSWEGSQDIIVGYWLYNTERFFYILTPSFFSSQNINIAVFKGLSLIPRDKTLKPLLDTIMFNEDIKSRLEIMQNSIGWDKLKSLRRSSTLL